MGGRKAITLIAFVAMVPSGIVRAHITAADPGFVITSDFGPRFADLVPDFHKGIDYRAPAGTSLPLLEPGSISRLSFADSGVDPLTGQILILELQTTNSHRFRYLHMFNNNSLPIHSGDFTLSTTTAGNLCIIHWKVGQFGVVGDYVLAVAGGQAPQVNGVPVVDSQGVELQTTNAAQSPIGASGGSGGFSPHMHIDLGPGVSENPLAHIVHPESGFSIEFRDADGLVRPERYFVSPNELASMKLRLRLDSTQGRDLEALELFVDHRTFATLIRDWSFGGLTSIHDPLHSDIENLGIADREGPVYSDGVGNGILPGGVGVEDFIFNWQTVQTAVSPNNLAEGQHSLLGCWTNIVNQTNCINKPFILDSIPPQPNIILPSGELIAAGGSTSGRGISILSASSAT